MLSRTAEDLFWLARYMERAENTARLLDVGLRMANLSPEAEADTAEWHSTVVAAGCQSSFYARYETPTAQTVLEHLACDESNSSSIVSCLETARSNSRAVRTALSADMWEAVNSTWLDLRSMCPQPMTTEKARRFLDWVKERSILFGGAYANTMLRNDAYWFVRLGTFLERADNTARILDVKYHVLLPDHESVGGARDYYQWAAILRSVSALRAYHWVYRNRLQPWLIADLLLLRPEMPRSLRSCFDEITLRLDSLAGAYADRGECHRLAGQMHSTLRYGRIEQIFQDGLHEFLQEFLAENASLGEEIATKYMT